MKVVTKYLAPISNVLNKIAEEVEVKEGATLKDLIDLLSAKYGRRLKDHFFDDKMEFKPKFIISINGESITDPHVELRDGDHVYFVQPVAGG